MRSVLAAALLVVSPVFASAQAVHGGISHLVASVDAPAFAFQASAVRVVSPRVFSGLVAPIRLTELKLNSSLAATHPLEITVKYDVTEAGVPENIQVVTPADKMTTARLTEAVSRIRYKAGTLDGEAVSMPVTLHVAVR